MSPDASCEQSYGKKILYPIIAKHLLIGRVKNVFLKKNSIANRWLERVMNASKD